MSLSSQAVSGGLSSAGSHPFLPLDLRNAARMQSRDLAVSPDLLGCTDEILLHIGTFLGAADLARLQLSTTRLVVKVMVGSAYGAEPVEMWSLTAEVARRRIAAHSAEQRAWIPRRPGESWLALAWELEQLCLPLSFSGAVSPVTFVPPWDGSEVALNEVPPPDAPLGGYHYRCAASAVVMRSGRHYAEFTLVDGQEHPDNHLGVVRPDWDATLQQYEAHRQRDHCFFQTFDGGCLNPSANLEADEPNDVKTWVGQIRADLGARIGMLLDLERGSLTVFKNDVLLGVMVESGLTGNYCWAATLYERGDCVRIESKPVPPRDQCGAGCGSGSGESPPL